MTEEKIQGIQNGLFCVVFASPEVINGDMWRDIIRKSNLRRIVHMVAIDEAHCVITWGKSFREDYIRITWLGPVFKDVPLLFLTAACTEKMKTEILKQFTINDVEVVAAVPNRPNIFLNCKSYPCMRLDKELTFYIEELREKGSAARKCIIYTRVNPAAEVYEEIKNRLKLKMFTGDGRPLVDMFVAKTSELAKEEILKTFPSPNSHIRCLIASIAFGMGVDIPDVELIIHWGVSSSILNYWQEVGRCGRDGRASEALLLATPRTVGDPTGTDDAVRTLIHSIKKDKACIRLTVLRALYLECMSKDEINRVSLKEKCQEMCSSVCQCSWCICCVNCRALCPCTKGQTE